jgi:glucokinase
MSAVISRSRAVAYYIGLDLGGTNIKGGLVDDQATALAEITIATEAAQGPPHVMERLATLAGQLLAQAGLTLDRIDGIAVGTPGPLSADQSVVLSAPNMPGWKNIPLRAELSKRIGRPVAVVNDANAAAYGEFWAGAGRQTSIKHMVLLTLGTGVGGGVVIAGRIFAGAHGAGTELGHTIIEPRGLPCGCGQHGCLEQYTSATGIAKAAQRRLDAGAVTALKPGATSKDIFTAAQADDAVALQIVEEFADYLGVACVNFVRIFDPQMIVIGGGVVAAGDFLIKRVRRVFEDRTWKVRPERVVIEAAKLGNRAGFIGAAGMSGSEPIG